MLIAHEIITREPALLIEFLVVGQVGFGHKTQYLALVHHHSAIEKVPVGPDWSSHNHDNVDSGRRLPNGHNSLLGAVEQHLVGKQVGTCVGCDAQLWKNHKLRPSIGSMPRTVNNLCHIVFNIGDIDLRHCCSYAYISVIVFILQSHLVISTIVTCKIKQFCRQPLYHRFKNLSTLNKIDKNGPTSTLQQ